MISNIVQLQLDELGRDIDKLSFPYDSNSSEPEQVLNSLILVHHTKDDGEVAE